MGLGIIFISGHRRYDPCFPDRRSARGNQIRKTDLKDPGTSKGGIEVVSCPTCGRTQIDLIGLANQVETLVQGYDLDIKVAVMGCVVNGPGEAKEADLGVAGGKGVGILIKKGEIVKKSTGERAAVRLKGRAGSLGQVKRKQE